MSGFSISEMITMQHALQDNVKINEIDEKFGNKKFTNSPVDFYGNLDII